MPDHKAELTTLQSGLSWSLRTLKCLYGLLNGLLYVLNFNLRYLPAVLALQGITEFAFERNDTDREGLTAPRTRYLRVFFLLRTHFRQK